MPKKVDIEKRKREITEKALQVFIEEGYQNAQLAQIAVECRMGRTTIYQYFKNKQELFHMVIKAASEKIDREYQTIIENESATALEKIRTFINRLLEESRQRRDLLIVLTDHGLHPKQNHNEIMETRYHHARNFQKKFRRLLSEGMETGEIRDLNSSTTSFVLYSLVASLILNDRFLRNWPVSEVRKSIDMLLDSLKNPSPPAADTPAT